MARKKTRSRANTRASIALLDLFQPYSIPPTPLHELIQEAAKQAGWTPPWDQRQSQAQQRGAGQKSASMRAGRAAIRRHFVRAAFERLKPAYRMQPFSNESIRALEDAYRNILAEDGYDPDFLMSAAPFRAGRETLIKDLKALGIRSRWRT